MPSYEISIQSFNKAAEQFIDAAGTVKVSKQVYDEGWNAKEVIAHIVFYHEYYARVVAAIVQSKDLPLIDESLALVNKRSAREESKFSKEILLSRFKAAHALLVKNLLLLESTTKIPYKKNGRIYDAISYVEEITRHIMRHTKDLKRNRRQKGDINT